MASAAGVTPATVKDALLLLAGTARMSALSAMSRLPAASLKAALGATAGVVTVLAVFVSRL